jgi:hypothetical protein
MTAALCGYSGVFMRYAMAVSPVNYLLFGCHLVNFSAQSTQAYRFINHWYMGGREKALEQKAKEGLQTAGDKAEGVLDQAKDLAAQAKAKVESATK